MHAAKLWAIYILCIVTGEYLVEVSVVQVRRRREKRQVRSGHHAKGGGGLGV